MSWPSVLCLMAALFTGMFGTAVAKTATEQLDAFFTDANSLDARFEQRVYDEKGELTQESSGTFKVLRPGRFRWEYKTPYPQLIVADGERVWIYDEALEQVTVKPFREALSATPLMLLSEQRPVEQDFSVVDTFRKQELDWVVIKPKTGETATNGDTAKAADTEFVKVAFGLKKDGQVAAMELTDQFGQRTEVEFSDLRTGVALDPAAFKFTVPPGVDVVGDAP